MSRPEICCTSREKGENCAFKKQHELFHRGKTCSSKAAAYIQEQTTQTEQTARTLAVLLHISRRTVKMYSEQTIRSL